ncbi:glycerophosphodiester phosphodiesterase family protein [Kitasatospora sp. NPDC001664]
MRAVRGRAAGGRAGVPALAVVRSFALHRGARAVLTFTLALGLAAAAPSMGLHRDFGGLRATSPLTVGQPGPKDRRPDPAGAFGTGTAADRAHRDLLDHGPTARVLTAAHRGQWRRAPENSLPAIRAAFDLGADIAEVDVRLTKDEVPVLMHDTTVDRTTDGRGAVADLTLAQLRKLRLREGLGGSGAAPTEERIPTLEEVMNLARDRGLINLDKGWPSRQAIWNVLARTGTVRNGLYKSNAPVSEVRAFLDTHPGAGYMHKITDRNRADVAAFGTAQPIAYEVEFNSTSDAVARKPFLDELARNSRIWINAMWAGTAARMTDEASLVDPRRGWGKLVRDHRASVLQTDDVEHLRSWLRTGAADPLPEGGVRVQAEDFLPGEGTGYHDLDPANRGGLARRPGEGVDLAGEDGAVRVCDLRGGEWLRYAVDVPATGSYALAARISSPNSRAGAYTVSFDDGPESTRVAVHGTTGDAMALRPSGVTRRLTAGRHVLRIALPADVPQTWNLDYLQLAPVID